MIDGESSPRSGCFGCSMGCIGAAIGVPLALVLIVYLVIFHSSLPLKWVASELAEDIDSDGNPVEFRGVGGSLASGLTAKKIIIHGETENSTIEGFKFRYTGLLDSIRNRQLVIEKLSIERSDIIVDPGFFDESTEKDRATESDTADEGSDGSPGEGDDMEPVKFELRELNFENTRFRTTDGEVNIEIPLFRLAGLKVEGDDFQLAELEVISDVLMLELLDAAPDEIEGQTVPFARKVQGKVLPGIHPLVISEIDFSVEFAAIGGETRSRVIACGGAIEQTLLPDGKSLVRFTDLTMGDFFDTEGQILPERLTTTAREAEKTVQVGSGEFYLGKTRFQIAEQQIDADDPKSAILGSAEVDGHAIQVGIRPDKERLWPPMAVEIASEPKLDPPQLLALIYFQRGYEELAPEEKSRIDELAKGMADQPELLLEAEDPE